MLSSVRMSYLNEPMKAHSRNSILIFSKDATNIDPDQKTLQSQKRNRQKYRGRGSLSVSGAIYFLLKAMVSKIVIITVTPMKAIVFQTTNGSMINLLLLIVNNVLEHVRLLLAKDSRLERASRY